MVQRSIEGKRIAILATDGVEQVELLQPKQALEEAGAITAVIAPKQGGIRGWNHTEWGETIPVDDLIYNASPDEFDALLLPGGVMNPDHLRQNKPAVDFVRAFFRDHKPVGAICHAPWMLVEAGVVKDRTLTSWPSLRTDIENAGGHWVDQEVVVDKGLVTSRKPDDIPAFNAKLIEEIVEGAHIAAPSSGAR